MQYLCNMVLFVKYTKYYVINRYKIIKKSKVVNLYVLIKTTCYFIRCSIYAISYSM